MGENKEVKKKKKRSKEGESRRKTTCARAFAEVSGSQEGQARGWRSSEICRMLPLAGQGGHNAVITTVSRIRF